jgi:hypothetical protein
MELSDSGLILSLLKFFRTQYTLKESLPKPLSRSLRAAHKETRSQSHQSAEAGSIRLSDSSHLGLQQAWSAGS